MAPQATIPSAHNRRGSVSFRNGVTALEMIVSEGIYRYLTQRPPDAFGRQRQLPQAYADGMGDGVADRRGDSEHAAFAHAFGAVRARTIGVLDQYGAEPGRHVGEQRHAIVNEVGVEYLPCLGH
jgi:hypothetical protein